MNKFLSLVGTVALSSSPVFANIGAINDHNISNYKKINELKLNHSIATKKTGTQEKDNIEKAFYATTQMDWQKDVMSVDAIYANGDFLLGTYHNPRRLPIIKLEYQSKFSNNNRRFWKSKDEFYTNDEWWGWGHQTSIITLEVTADWKESENLITFTLLSYVYARTAGASHKCQTNSKVDYLDFSER